MLSRRVAQSGHECGTYNSPGPLVAPFCVSPAAFISNTYKPGPRTRIQSLILFYCQVFDPVHHTVFGAHLTLPYPLLTPLHWQSDYRIQRQS